MNPKYSSQFKIKHCKYQKLLSSSDNRVRRYDHVELIRISLLNSVASIKISFLEREKKKPCDWLTGAMNFQILLMRLKMFIKLMTYLPNWAHK